MNLGFDCRTSPSIQVEERHTSHRYSTHLSDLTSNFSSDISLDKTDEITHKVPADILGTSFPPSSP